MLWTKVAYAHAVFSSTLATNLSHITLQHTHTLAGMPWTKVAEAAGTATALGAAAAVDTAASGVAGENLAWA